MPNRLFCLEILFLLTRVLLYGSVATRLSQPRLRVLRNTLNDDETRR